ncbi:MAG: hypothetical protein LQ338_000137 [Usnochroma carphineum]|nr:MAG: hypothetical protein LQ338_000137 [Usnochroma carphineum]
MHPALSTSYLLPAVFLNPVLFLHGLNTVLSRIIPPVVVAGPVQPPPYSTFGPSANHPHLDMHASDNICWSYTVVMICAQLMAFGRVQRLREENKEKKRLKKEYAEAGKVGSSGKTTNRAIGQSKMPSTAMKSCSVANGSVKSRAAQSSSTGSRSPDNRLSDAERYSPDTGEDSEVIL